MRRKLVRSAIEVLYAGDVLTVKIACEGHNYMLVTRDFKKRKPVADVGSWLMVQALANRISINRAERVMDMVELLASR